MKKILNLSIILAALALASSCQDEAGLNPPEPQTVTIKAGAGLTKTLLEGDAVKWEAGDAIDLRFTHPVNAPAIHQFSTDDADVAADFTGKLPLEVTREDSEYANQAYAVYPSGALTGEGAVAFALPSEQKVREDGTFAKGLNLASASVLLSDIQDDGNASATFMNALSIIRFSVKSDVKSVTLTGTSPLAGTAPLNFGASGRLVVDADGKWTGASNTVTVLPAEGKECFDEGEVNLLVWPGTHSEMSVTVNFAEFGEFHKSKTFDFEFVPAKYYTLDLNADSETIVSELVGEIGGIEDELDDLEDRLAALETTAQKVSLLLDQIQSVSLMTEYLDNAVYAPYGRASSGSVKKPITLDYIVRPAKAMDLLLDICSDKGNLSEVLSAKIDYQTGSLGDLTVRDAVLTDDVLTVTVDAGNVDGDFYDGDMPAAVALQISDGSTEIISDFANLIPKQGLVMNVYKSTDVPAIKGTTLAFQFDYSSFNIANVTGSVENVRGFKDKPTVNLNTYKGTVRATFADNDNMAAMGFSIVLKDSATGEEESVDFTFEDVGDMVIECPAGMFYVGGQVNVNVVMPQNNYQYKDPDIHLTNTWTEVEYYRKETQSGTPGGAPIVSVFTHKFEWAYETVYGNQGVYTVDPNVPQTAEVTNPDKEHFGDSEKITVTINTGENERSFNVNVEVQTNDPMERAFTYYKTVTVTQSKNGTAIDESLYYHNNDYVVLQEATAACADYLNVVIVGDGYQKADLFKGGNFERHARSACGAFFGAAPFNHFRDRFNVYMMPFESEDAGPRHEANNGHSTYFGTYYQAADNTWVNYSDEGKDRVISAVKNTLGLTGADYYRTIVIMLVNTDISLGSTNYPSQTTVSGVEDPGDGYASFGISILAAKVMNINSLVRHEAAGHAFGRLGDEYEVSWYTPALVENERHNVGFYRNVATTKNYWKAFTDAGYGSDKVMYDPYGNNLYRSTHESGIMWDNNGYFNAVSRHAIYERIIKQTEGYNAYSWEKFLEYDKRNIN